MYAILRSNVSMFASLVWKNVKGAYELARIGTRKVWTATRLVARNSWSLCKMMWGAASSFVVSLSLRMTSWVLRKRQEMVEAAKVRKAAKA